MTQSQSCVLPSLGGSEPPREFPRGSQGRPWGLEGWSDPQSCVALMRVWKALLPGLWCRAGRTGVLSLLGNSRPSSSSRMLRERLWQGWPPRPLCGKCGFDLILHCAKNSGDLEASLGAASGLTPGTLEPESPGFGSRFYHLDSCPVGPPACPGDLGHFGVKGAFTN